MLQQGQQFPLTIKRLGINGEGVGYFKNKSCSFRERFREKKSSFKRRTYTRRMRKENRAHS